MPCNYGKYFSYYLNILNINIEYAARTVVNKFGIRERFYPYSKLCYLVEND